MRAMRAPDQSEVTLLALMPFLDNRRKIYRMIPSHISHYYVRGSKPFQTISELDDDAWRKLCSELADRRRTDPSYNRRFGFGYRGVRLEAEEKLRECFRAKGGLIKRNAPIYFCLGSSDWWSGFCDHREIRIDLQDIDPKAISFTYPDSLTSMGMLERFGIRHEARPYHGKVFTLDEIKEVVNEFGMPEGSSLSEYTEYHKEELEIYIEAQLWSDDPILAIQAFGNQEAIKTEHSIPRGCRLPP